MQSQDALWALENQASNLALIQLGMNALAGAQNSSSARIFLDHAELELQCH
jgi:hypothetical protein